MPAGAVEGTRPTVRLDEWVDKEPARPSSPDPSSSSSPGESPPEPRRPPSGRRPKPPAPPFPALERWMKGKESRSLVPRTLSRYRRAIATLLEALRREGRPTDPSKWTLEDALRIRSLLHGGVWELGIAADFARSFGNNVLKEAGLPGKPPASGRVRWLSKLEVEAIVRATREDPLLAFVAFLGLGQGLRRVEWQRLQVGDIDLPGRRLLVRGKGRSHPKLQWVAMHPAFPQLFEGFARYRDGLVKKARARHPARPVAPEALVHPTPKGLAPYSSSGLDNLVRQIEQRVRKEEGGVAVRLSSHMFRRSGATLLEEALLKSPNASIDGVYRVVQGFLRHDNLVTTMRYLEANPARQRRALVEFAQAIPWATNERNDSAAADPTAKPRSNGA